MNRFFYSVLLGLLVFSIPCFSQTSSLKYRDTNAAWLNFGLGPGNANFHKRSAPSEMIHVAMGLNVRHHWQVFSIGLDGYGSECWDVGLYYGLFGVSSHAKNGEFTIAAGPSITQWSHNTESSYGTIESASYLGGTVMAQFIAHFP